MKRKKIELNPEEKNLFEYKLYQYIGMQIAINQFLSSDKFEYSEDHYIRITNTYTEKYQLLSEYIMKLMKERDISGVPVQLLDYRYMDGVLDVIYKT